MSWILYFANYINGLVQDCGDSSALAMELLQFCAKPPVCPDDKIVLFFYWYKYLLIHVVLLSGILGQYGTNLTYCSFQSG